MADYEASNTQFVEKLAVDLLNRAGIGAVRNNLEDVSAVDVKTADGIKIDVQYSKQFARYGDYRLDIVSAFLPREVSVDWHYVYQPALKFFANFQQKYRCRIAKYGKLFQPDYLDALMILFYHDELNRAGLPDHLLIINKSDVLAYLNAHQEACFQRIILNNKFGLDDRHGSAFIPINVEELVAFSPACFWGSVPQLLSGGETVRDYLSRQSILLR